MRIQYVQGTLKLSSGDYAVFSLHLLDTSTRLGDLNVITTTLCATR